MKTSLISSLASATTHCYRQSSASHGSVRIVGLARVVFRDSKEDFLPRFRWAHKTSSDDFLADRNFPPNKDRWSAMEEGVSLPNYRSLPTPYPRAGDDLVLVSLRDGVSTFPDAGIFMMDCGQPTILVLCAGHGGCGTLGCLTALRDTEQIDDLLEISRTRKASSSDTKADRIVGVVAVNRRKKSQSSETIGASVAGANIPDEIAVDDLEIASARMVWASVPYRDWA